MIFDVATALRSTELGPAYTEGLALAGVPAVAGPRLEGAGLGAPLRAAGGVTCALLGAELGRGIDRLAGVDGGVA